jgi:hypothetical protein
MGMFDTILEKLGIKKSAEEKQASQPSQRQEQAEAVDVKSMLEKKAKGTNLDWRVSIVDLLKLLGMESSLEARKELARELGAPPDVMQDNVKMNVWLHKTVMARVAANGGNVPKELLD